VLRACGDTRVRRVSIASPGPAEPPLAPAPLDTIDPATADPAQQERLARWLEALGETFLQPAEARRRLAAARFGPAPSVAALAGLARLAAAGARAVPYGSPAYPSRLSGLGDAPACLFVRGDVAALSARAVAIVGSRAPTPYGVGVAHALAADLARAGLVVVSGLARGIDAAAHRGALEAGGRTVAIQACGPEQVYPRQHRGLAQEIVRSGAIATEFPPGAPPARLHFPLRNRVISGLAEALVVVEARERSGTLSTVAHALDQGRDVFAVPGPITRETSRGPNRLLRDGAFVLLGAEDVLERLGVRIAARGAEPAVAPGRTAGLGAAAARALGLLASGPLGRDALGRRLALPEGELALALVELELAGLVVEDRDGRLAARAAP